MRFDSRMLFKKQTASCLTPNKNTSGRSISRILSMALGFDMSEKHRSTQPPRATVRSSLWAARHRSAQCNLPRTDSLTV